MKLPAYVDNILNFLGEKEAKYTGNPQDKAAARMRKELIDESLTAKNPSPRDPEKETRPEIESINPIGSMKVKLSEKETDEFNDRFSGKKAWARYLHTDPKHQPFPVTIIGAQGPYKKMNRTYVDIRRDDTGEDGETTLRLLFADPNGRTFLYSPKNTQYDSPPRVRSRLSSFGKQIIEHSKGAKRSGFTRSVAVERFLEAYELAEKYKAEKVDSSLFSPLLKRFKPLYAELSGATFKQNPKRYPKGPTLPPEVIEKFHELAALQRGKPETAMMRARNFMGGGVLAHAIEHVGDINHRMNEALDSFNSGSHGWQNVMKKARDLHFDRPGDWMSFKKEHEWNTRSNFDYYKKEGKNGKPFTMSYEEFLAEIARRLNAYADEHEKLPVYNQPQFWAREAAVALGRQKFARANYFLQKIRAFEKDLQGWLDATSKYDQNFETRTQKNPRKGKMGRIEWSDDEVRDIVSSYLLGHSMYALAAKYSVSDMAISNLLRKQNVPIRLQKGENWLRDKAGFARAEKQSMSKQYLMALDLFLEGLSIAEISDKTGLASFSIGSELRHARRGDKSQSLLANIAPKEKLARLKKMPKANPWPQDLEVPAEIKHLTSDDLRLVKFKLYTRAKDQRGNTYTVRVRGGDIHIGTMAVGTALDLIQFLGMTIESQNLQPRYKPYLDVQPVDRENVGYQPVIQNAEAIAYEVIEKLLMETTMKKNPISTQKELDAFLHKWKGKKLFARRPYRGIEEATLLGGQLGLPSRGGGYSKAPYFRVRFKNGDQDWVRQESLRSPEITERRATIKERKKLIGNARLSEGHDESEFDARELARGTKHEMEHTDDAEEAKRIAMDHLVEEPRYYSKLAKCSIKNPDELVDKRDSVKEAAKKMLALNEKLPKEYQFTADEIEDLRRDAGEIVESQNPTRPSVAELGKVFKEKNTITWEDPKTKQKKKIQVPGFLDSNFADAIRSNPNLSKKEKDEKLEESWREIELFIQKLVDTSLENVMRLRLEQSPGGEPGARPLPGALEFPSKRDRRYRPEERVEIMEDVERNRYYKLLLTTYLMSLLRKFFFLDPRSIKMIEEQLGGDKPRLQKRLYGNREAFAQSIFTGMVALTGRINPVNLLRWLQANEPTVKDAYASANERWAKIQEAYGKKGRREADARREAREKEKTSIEDLAPEEKRDEGKRDLAELAPRAESAASAPAAPRAPRSKQESAPSELISAVRSLSATWPARQKGMEQKRKATPHRGIAGRKRGQESA